MTAKIQLIGVKKRFGPKVVLDGVDLTVEAGSSLVIIGGSGTGKSVTIKSILGIIRPDEGTILVDGEDVTHINGAALDRVMKKFGMLFQGGALFDSLPVWENVAFGLIQGRGMGRLKARDIAILGSDHPQYVSPSELRGAVHDFSLLYLGVHLFDNCDLEALADAAAARRRWEFLLTAAPLPIRGGTGSPANPIATF